jgi:hypothetical protein
MTCRKVALLPAHVIQDFVCFVQYFHDLGDLAVRVGSLRYVQQSWIGYAQCSHFMALLFVFFCGALFGRYYFCVMPSGWLIDD